MGVISEATIYARADNENTIIDAVIKQFDDLAESIVASIALGFDDSCRIALYGGSWIQAKVACNNIFAYEKISGLNDWLGKAQPCSGDNNILDLINMFNCTAICSYEFQNGKTENDILERLVAVCGDVGGLVMHPGMRLYDGKGNVVFRR
ncbi:MAG: hypothetical protein FWG10_12110 [Eubacteriaceae bacterium]|nr:hypothetical protein [Eubacteriaceae bacterium]